MSCTPCTTPDCLCPVKDLGTDCSVYNQDQNLNFIGSPKGTILSVVLQNINTAIGNLINNLGTYFSIVNIGGGAKVYAGDGTQGQKQLKTLTYSEGITITETASEINFTLNSEILELLNNLQRTITSNITLADTDNNYSILINNGANPITVTVPTGLMEAFNVAFIQLGTGEVTFVGSGVTINSPLSLKIKGQNYWAYLEKVEDSTVYQLLGALGE